MSVLCPAFWLVEKVNPFASNPSHVLRLYNYYVALFSLSIEKLVYSMPSKFRMYVSICTFELISRDCWEDHPTRDTRKVRSQKKIGCHLSLSRTERRRNNQWITNNYMWETLTKVSSTFAWVLTASSLWYTAIGLLCKNVWYNWRIKLLNKAPYSKRPSGTKIFLSNRILAVAEKKLNFRHYRNSDL